ncbi:hypothetical protein HGQ17_06305 [Nesterenkonia sp. MY13]|uniref:Uncharacterized protein n=2 Tax=Nesterenkonia sedimenti TaxID=1463632 RepID=A0A7X8TIZ5_9MICC|nr:hypothetical protein [Nesterenkonia sedimenti]
MPKLTFIFGAILVVVGGGGYVFSLTNNTDHWTALIPAIIGVLLLISGAIALKNLMAGIHIALLIALVGALGMFMPLMNLGELFAGEAERPAAIISALISLIVLVVYIILGVRSFLAARRWKKG